MSVVSPVVAVAQSARDPPRHTDAVCLLVEPAKSADGEKAAELAQPAIPSRMTAKPCPIVGVRRESGF